MRSLVTVRAKRDDVFRTVGGPQPGLPLQVRLHLASASAALPAGERVAHERSIPSRLDTELMPDIEPDVNSHPERHRQQSPAARPQHERGGERARRMEGVGGGALRRMRAAEIANRRARIDTASAGGEPEIVVNVDKDA